ncbi:MAG: hypothetical protein R3B09_35505 [Nannocystaceae bacterium]
MLRWLGRASRCLDPLGLDLGDDDQPLLALGVDADRRGGLRVSH